MPGAVRIRGRLYELGIAVAVFALAFAWKGMLSVEWAAVGVVLGAGIVVADGALHRPLHDE